MDQATVSHFLVGLLTEMGYPQRPIGVDEDNTGVFAIARNEGKYAHRRHINIKYHLCQKFLGTLYFLRDVRSDDNVADIMTKSIFAADKFEGYRDRLLCSDGVLATHGQQEGVLITAAQ